MCELVKRVTLTMWNRGGGGGGRHGARQHFKAETVASFSSTPLSVATIFHRIYGGDVKLPTSRKKKGAVLSIDAHTNAGTFE
jgi:hypothetical protein